MKEMFIEVYTSVKLIIQALYKATLDQISK